MMTDRFVVLFMMAGALGAPAFFLPLPTCAVLLLFLVTLPLSLTDKAKAKIAVAAGREVGDTAGNPAV